MRLSSLLCVLLVWEWKSTNGNLGTLSKLLLSHFRIRAVVVEKKGTTTIFLNPHPAFFLHFFIFFPLFQLNSSCDKKVVSSRAAALWYF